jgi:hypothetical protein
MVVGKLDIRPTAAAANARSKRLAPNVPTELNPRVGCVSIAVKQESAPAIVHAIDDDRPAKTPDSRAASLLADDARSANPKRLRFRNTTSAQTITGDRKSMPE